MLKFAQPCQGNAVMCARERTPLKSDSVKQHEGIANPEPDQASVRTPLLQRNAHSSISVLRIAKSLLLCHNAERPSDLVAPTEGASGARERIRNHWRWDIEGV